MIEGAVLATVGRETEIVADFEVVPSLLRTLTLILPPPFKFGVTETLFVVVVVVPGDQPEGNVHEYTN